MSSMVYPTDGLSNAEDPSGVPVGTIIPHPYLNSNPNVAYAAAAAAAAAAASSGSPSSNVGQYPHYYGHSQQLFNVPQNSGFYPPTMNPSHGHPTDFNTSSPSVASSSSSIDSARKPTNRKRNADKQSSTTTKSTSKRKLNNDDDLDAAAAGGAAGLDDDDNDDDEENKCYLRGAASMGNMMMSNNHPHPPSGVAGEEDKEKQARENHCEIERRRRVKMATYFAELCDMVPSCANLARKPDKLTILRMAAQFMKTLRTNNNSLTLNSTSLSSGQDLHKPSFLNDQELKYLMVESCDAFLFALNCDNLRVIYISDAIQQILSYTCQDWYSRFFYDFVHPDDVEKVREQLNLQSPDASPNGACNARVLDLKTGTVKKDGHSTGARLVSSKRSFICRLRVGTTNVHDGNHSNPFVNPSFLRRRHRTALGPSIDGHLYEVVHISGYIRNLNNHPTSNHDNLNLHHHHHPTSSNSNSQMAFIAIARIQNSCSPNVNDLTNGSISSLNSFTTEFTCRCHSETGEILFIDQRCTPIIGYKSHELLHKILFDQLHLDDQMKFQDLFKRTVTQKNLVNPSANLNQLILRFRTNLENDFVSLKCSTYAFCNPCTDEIEFIIVTFLSSQTTSNATTTSTPTTTNNKTSVIANTNDYHSQTYETYARTTTASNNSSVMSTRYPTNPDEQSYASNPVETTDGRTYVSNNGGSTWATANENWDTRNTANYLDPQSQLSIYHQYH